MPFEVLEPPYVDDLGNAPPVELYRCGGYINVASGFFLKYT